MRSRRRRGGAAWDIVVPPPEREQHGAVERLAKPIADSAGAVARPYRAIDLLAAMERRGAITAAMLTAGEDFRRHFQVAHFDPLHAADLQRAVTAIRGTSDDALGGRIYKARDKVWRALLAAGGVNSAGGSCLWHVVGFERALKEWALTGTWNGRRIAQETASGILIAALGALEAHFNGAAQQHGSA